MGHKNFVFLLSILIFHIFFHNVNARLMGEKIVGGDLAEEGQFSYTVSVRLLNTHICGGSIIDSWHILTAAHCFYDKYGFPEPRISIRAGVILANDTSGINVNVSKIYIPKTYYYSNVDKKRNKLRDIAVLKLEEELDLGQDSQLRKLNLPGKIIFDDGTSDYSRYINQTATVTGFGANDIKSKFDKVLQEVVENSSSDYKLRYASAKVLSNQECRKLYKAQLLFVQHYHICAQLVQRDNEKPEGVCSGDSGGPLVHENKTIIGLLSTSPKLCTETIKPAKYVRISWFIPFIKDAFADVNLDTMHVGVWSNEEEEYLTLE